MLLLHLFLCLLFVEHVSAKNCNYTTTQEKLGEHCFVSQLTAIEFPSETLVRCNLIGPFEFRARHGKIHRSRLLAENCRIENRGNIGELRKVRNILHTPTKLRAVPRPTNNPLALEHRVKFWVTSSITLHGIAENIIAWNCGYDISYNIAWKWNRREPRVVSLVTSR